ncbi:DUF2487 family protein [Sinobaca sp. H24]|uniref:DUF2487 family protein n=1 Tax=Sinobaca sp. H24 TaxID=2923376 RepID=UPI00207A3AE9|nr:DUF2487 family protein [Sinobaca sp. H24]
MKWTADDMTVFLREKQYIDTLLLPLQPVSFTNEMKQSASMQEFVEALTREMEKQFKGRVMLSPAFPYLKQEPVEEQLPKIQKWIQEAKEGGFSHIILITSDASWKQVEKILTECSSGCHLFLLKTWRTPIKTNHFRTDETTAAAAYNEME